jgi:hypothetical protein
VGANAVSESGYAVFCGLDIDKSAHHAAALNAAGGRLHDAALPRDEQRLRRLFGDLRAYGPVLVVVDQPATIGALPLAVARAVGCQVCLPARPGDAPDRRPAYGSAKTDARDAYVIVEAARTMPHTLRQVDVGEEALAELGVLMGSTMTWPSRRTGSATESVVCSPRSTRRWSGYWARRPPRRGCCSC